MENIKDKQSPNVHAGHRKRLKEKAKDFGFKTFQDHEVLEMLLTYTIPRKNTNPIAHTLLQEFGNISNVIDANYLELTKVDGVGKETALFLNCISNVVERYQHTRQKRLAEFIRNVHDLVVFFRKHFIVKNYEECFLICTNKNNKVVKTHKIEGDDQNKVEFTTKELASHIVPDEVAFVAVVHTHPNGECKPSFDDVNSTKTILNTCMNLGIGIIDHLIINENSHYSFRTSGALDLIKADYLKNNGALTIKEYGDFMKKLSEEE